jgi:hypothetical protein
MRRRRDGRRAAAEAEQPEQDQALDQPPVTPSG